MSRLVECTHCGAFVAEGAGHTLLDCVGHLRQVSRSVYAAGYTGVLQREITDLRAALTHERDRARRVVRVFWRVRSVDVVGLPICLHYPIRAQAMAVGARHKSIGGKVYYVTVRRVAKKAAT